MNAATNFCSKDLDVSARARIDSGVGENTMGAKFIRSLPLLKYGPLPESAEVGFLNYILW
jgi:hypothetical protein